MQDTPKTERFQTFRSEWLPGFADKIGTKYKYHSLAHTLSVVESTREICDNLNLQDWEKDLLLTAALLHDSGFMEHPKDHEQTGCRITCEILPAYGYQESEIKEICSMIMATKIPQKPESVYGQILCDADLAYLGTEHYDTIAETLYHEINEFGGGLSREQWLDLQISFLESHTFFTTYAKAKFDPAKQAHLDKLRKIREESRAEKP
jgi:uncharacterized protein